MRYFFIDTETGGLDPNNASLLQIAVVVTDDRFNTIDKLYLKTRPYDSVFMVHPKALDVNSIDIVQHARDAVSYGYASQRIKDFIYDYRKFDEYALWAGWNVQFDLKFLNHYIIETDILTYRLFDVQGIFHFYATHVNNEPYSMSLTNAAKYFGLDSDGLHKSALEDALMTIKIAQEIRDHILCLS